MKIYLLKYRDTKRVKHLEAFMSKAPRERRSILVRLEGATDICSSMEMDLPISAKGLIIALEKGAQMLSQ